MSEYISPSEYTCYLTINSWQGYSLGAVHFYGNLVFKDNSQPVIHKLTLKEVKELNKLDGYVSYKKGDSSNRFNTQEALIEAAKKTWKDIYPEALVLVIGESYDMLPRDLEQIRR